MGFFCETNMKPDGWICKVYGTRLKFTTTNHHYCHLNDHTPPLVTILYKLVHENLHYSALGLRTSSTKLIVSLSLSFLKPFICIQNIFINS